MLDFQTLDIRKTEDGRLSVYDLIKVVGGKANPRDAWNSLVEQYPDCVGKTDTVVVQGKHKKKALVCRDTASAMYIIGLLPGITGKTYREEAARIVTSYLTTPEDLAVEAFEKIKSPVKRQQTLLRQQGIHNRKLLTEAMKDLGLEGYAGMTTNKGYGGHLGGNAAYVRMSRGLPEGANIREHMDDEELAITSLYETLTAKAIREGAATDLTSINETNYKHAKGIADSVRQLKGNTKKDEGIDY